MTVYYLIPETEINTALINLSVSWRLSDVRFVQNKNNSSERVYIIETSEQNMTDHNLINRLAYRKQDLILKLIDYEDVEL